MGDELRSTITEDALDRQLREAVPYVDDAGFTARVLARLPAPQRELQSVRGAILLGLTLLGSALAYVLTDSGRFILVSVVRLANLPVVWVFILTFAIGVLAIGGAFAAAMAKLHEAQT
jgi:hypothetical protein